MTDVEERERGERHRGKGREGTVRERGVSHLQHVGRKITKKQLNTDCNFEQSQAEFIHMWVLRSTLLHIPKVRVQINEFYSQLCLEMVR